MVLESECKPGDHDLEWASRVYVEEVWAYLYPKSHRRRAPVDEKFLQQVEESCIGDQDPTQFRSRFAEVVKAYAWTGIKFSFKVDPVYSRMFRAYCERYGTDSLFNTSARQFDMKRLLSYIDLWVSNSAYFIWESEGRPCGRHAEHWRLALQRFLESHGKVQR